MVTQKKTNSIIFCSFRLTALSQEIRPIVVAFRRMRYDICAVGPADQFISFSASGNERVARRHFSSLYFLDRRGNLYGQAAVRASTLTMDGSLWAQKNCPSTTTAPTVQRLSRTRINLFALSVRPLLRRRAFCFVFAATFAAAENGPLVCHTDSLAPSYLYSPLGQQLAGINK